MCPDRAAPVLRGHRFCIGGDTMTDILNRPLFDSRIWIKSLLYPASNGLSLVNHTMPSLSREQSMTILGRISLVNMFSNRRVIISTRPLQRAHLRKERQNLEVSTLILYIFRWSCESIWTRIELCKWLQQRFREPRLVWRTWPPMSANAYQIGYTSQLCIPRGFHQSTNTIFYNGQWHLPYF